MTVSLTLGPITFANNEIPGRINFGGDQMLSIKRFVGGKRQIDALGRDDDFIHWSGMFFGSTATFRAQYLDGIRVAGQALPLTYSQFNYSVVIKSFKPVFELPNQIPYSITLAVIQDLNKPFPTLIPVAYNDAILNMLNEANDIALELQNPSISSAMALLSETINAIPSLSDASNVELATVTASITATESVVSSSISALSGEIF